MELDSFGIIADAHEKAMYFFKTSEKKSVDYPIDPDAYKDTERSGHISAWEEHADRIDYEVEKHAMTQKESTYQFINLLTELNENPRIREEMEDRAREYERACRIPVEDLFRQFNI